MDTLKKEKQKEEEVQRANHTWVVITGSSNSFPSITQVSQITCVDHKQAS
jgi:hypothetical protein